MSRRKQARPKSCKAEDLDSDTKDDITVKMEDVVDCHDEGGNPNEDLSSQGNSSASMKTPADDSIKIENSNESQRSVTSSPGYDVTPFAAVESMEDTNMMKEMRCESCGLQFESLDKFMDHRNTECRNEKNDMKPTEWLVQERSTMDSVSPSSHSTNGGGAADEAYSIGVNEDDVEGEGLKLDDLDPTDIPYVIGVTTDNPYGCTFCEKAFPFLSHLHKHEQTHTAQMPYKCSHCTRHFRHQKSRERHERLHSADRKYRCKVCGVGYSRSDHLRNHMKNHDATERGVDASNKCPLCSLSFSSPITLANHLKKHKEEESESPDSLSKTCLECHQVFGSDQQLLQHICPSGAEEEMMQQHDGQSSILELKCPVCNDIFLSMESLCHHLMSHRSLNLEAVTSTQAGATTADIPNASFGLVEENNKENKGSNSEVQSSNRNTLNSNSSSSTNPLVCPYCLIEGFESLEGLELHLTSVHNVKPTEVYTCNYCNAPYPNLYSLHDHMTVVHRSQHGLDITYPCSMCVQRFHSLDALAKHKGIVHAQHHSTGIDAAFCNRCNMTLSSPRSLEDHMATVHNIIMEKQPVTANKNTSKHSNKGKKSGGGKNSLKGVAASSSSTHHKTSNSTTTHNNNTAKTSTSPKKQSSSSLHSHSHSSTKDINSLTKKSNPMLNSTSPSLSSSPSSPPLTSPPLQSIAATNPVVISPPFLPSYPIPDSVHASNTLRISSLLAKEVAGFNTGSEKIAESLGTATNGMTCDHCNATFHDIQNYTAHLVHHTGSLLGTTSSSSPSSSSSGGGSSGPHDKWNGFQHHHIVTPSSGQRELNALQTGMGRRTSSRSGSATADASETRTNLHECFKCKATFPSSDQLETHLLLHYLRVSTEYGCSNCAKNFSKPDELQRHLMDIHAHHLYRCSLCKEIFDSKVNIQVHFAIKHSDECKLYRCAACELNFHSEMEWQVHVRVNHLHISRPYRCLFCQESFTSEVELQCHLTTHSKPFVCPMCSQAFHIEYLLDQHMQQNHGDVKPNLTQQAPRESTSPTPLGLLIPTTIKQELDQEQLDLPNLSRNVSPSISPHFSVTPTRMSPQNRNNNASHPPSPSPLSTTTKTILKSPTATTLGKLSQNSSHSHSQVQGRNSSTLSTRGSGNGNSTSGAAAIPTVWKNSEPLHMCNICDIKFNDFSLLMIHKAQDHDLKSLGKLLDKSRDCEDNTDRNQFESSNTANDVQSASIANSTHSSTSTDTHQTVGSRLTTPSYHHATATTTPPSCMFCSQTFKNNVDYEKHMKIHVNSGNLTCSICDETFSSPSVLAEHKLMHCKIHQGNTCVVCRVTLGNKEQFYAHTQEHGFEGTQLQCVVCRQSLSSLVELQMHGRHHFQSNNSFFTCCVCLKSFESRENLVSKLNSSGRTYYVCKPCYHGEAPPLHTCSQCSEKFATAQLLDIHMLTHKSSFQCIKCQQSFSSEYEIQLHVATHLMTEGTQHECRLCGTSCDTPARLQTHLIQHSFSAMDIVCFVCNKTFESPQEIQVHVLEHSSSYKKYSCNRCPQRFFFTAELENHKLTYNHLSDNSPPPPLPSDGNISSSSATHPTSSLSSPPSSNFHASALLASLSASPLNSNSDSFHHQSSAAIAKVSKLFSSPQFRKNSTTGKDVLSPSSGNKHRLPVTSSSSSSSSSPPSSKIMKIDKSKRKGGGGGGSLTIPNPTSSSLSAPKRLECSDCHKFFTTGTALANHRKTHMRKEAKTSVKCSLCDAGFPSATAMQQHFFSAHSATEKKEEDEEGTLGEKKHPVFECMMCQKVCTTLSALQNHILSHRTQSIASSITSDAPKADVKPSKESDCEEMEIPQYDVASDKKEVDDDDISSEDTCLLACPVCNQVFLKAEDIDDHIKTHQELFIFQSNEHEATSDAIENQTEDKEDQTGDMVLKTKEG